MLSACVAAALALAPAACGYTEIRQSSLVPLPAMPPPMSPRRRADLQIGDSIVSYVGTRELRPNANAGLWLPRHQLDGSISVRLSRYFGLRLLGGAGFPTGATAASPTTLPSPAESTWWGGIGAIATHRDASGFGLDVELDTLAAAIPSLLQSRYCDSDGGCGAWSPLRPHTDWVAMLAGTVRVSYAFAEWAVIYGGATVRSHPTNNAAFTDVLTTSSVEMGGPVLLLGIGAELTVGDVLSIIPHVTWPALGGPVSYGPMFGIALRIRFADGPGDALPPWPGADVAGVAPPGPTRLEAELPPVDDAFPAHEPEIPPPGGAGESPLAVEPQ